MSFRFVILGALHSGGSGDLFIAQRTDTGEYVVAKYLREHQLVHARRAFAREVRILARNPRGLVRLLGWNTDAEHPYYVMPYFTGGALTRYAGGLSDSQLYAVATELALTLAGLHAQWIAHGDVKPDNVLISHDGRLHIADPLGNGFGCTMLFSQNHGGTPGYWAPEVRAGGAISNAGDVYSFGATLYELLTGRRPQDGRRLDPTSEGYRNAPKIREIIAACCQPDSKARPTMQEVLRVLRGEQWAAIQAARKQRQQFLTAACVVVIFVLCARGSAGA